VSKNIRSIEEIARDIEKLRDEVQDLIEDDSGKLAEASQHASTNGQPNVAKITGMKLRA